MTNISVFDIFKIGIGPSSSHTLGPWKAALDIRKKMEAKNWSDSLGSISVHLYGSLALTGKGHGSDIAIMLGLAGKNPVNIPLEEVSTIPDKIQRNNELPLFEKKTIAFHPEKNILYHPTQFLHTHPNGLIFQIFDLDQKMIYEQEYYSIGGGFITTNIKEEEGGDDYVFIHEMEYAKNIIGWCHERNEKISTMALENELTIQPLEQIYNRLDLIWETMENCVYRGCQQEGYLPGSLSVKRRAKDIQDRLLESSFTNHLEWFHLLCNQESHFKHVNNWVSCFALAVNEENASLGRVVTAPTNGAAGVIPAVLMYYLCFEARTRAVMEIRRFLLTASVVGAMFQKRATISAAMGGCQAEIGVSSAMAAAGLTECMGGTPAQCMMAAEIAMEHHLGLTCDPVDGLVQVPCIERNSMGAIKAITATQLALDGNPAAAKVTLDDIIDIMWETAKDMNHKYKETSLGGLAAKIKVGLVDC